MNTKSKQSHEKIAKAALLQHLLHKGAVAEDVVIISELALESFSRRADLALVNGSIELFEIKSEADTLTRLAGQVETFSRFCDKLHVVGAPCHIDNILSSTSEHVAVWQLESGIGIRVMRRGRKTPLRDKANLIKLINAQELKQLLATNKIKVDSSRRKYLEAAAHEISAEKLRFDVLKLLKERYAETTARFLNAVFSQKEAVQPKHIAALKRVKSALPAIAMLPKWQDITVDGMYNDDVHMRQLAHETKESLFGSPPEDVKLLLHSA
jgi:hypothetical protein